MTVRLSDLLRTRVAPGGAPIEESWIQFQCHECMRETAASDARTMVSGDTTAYYCHCGNLLAKAAPSGYSSTGGLGVTVPPSAFN